MTSNPISSSPAPSVLITGASQGLGRELALALGTLNTRLVLVARRAEPLQALAQEIRARGGTAFAVPADLSKRSAVHGLASRASELVGPIEILINNVSTLGPTPLRSLMDTRDGDLSQVFETNFMGPFRLTQILLGPMLIRNHGTILNISSDAAISAYPDWGAYGASKIAWDHLNRIWAEELRSSAIHFIRVDPGEMNTQMHRDALPDADPSALLAPSAVAERILLHLNEQGALSSSAQVRRP